MSTPHDANVGFILSRAARSRLIHVLDNFAAALPQASSLLIDRAGRIVEIARKPLGVKLEAVSALAAGCFASTDRLAHSMGEESFALFFEHSADLQVYVWPVGDQALLVILLKGTESLAHIEQQLEGQVGKELAEIMEEVRTPLQAVPPPRLAPLTVPAEVQKTVGEFNTFVTQLQAERPNELNEAVQAKILHARGDIGKSMSRQRWDEARRIAEDTRAWLTRMIPK